MNQAQSPSHDYTHSVRTQIEPLAAIIFEEVRQTLADYPVERISYRVKTVESFEAKSKRIHKKTGKLRYPQPLRDITDIIGVRVVVRFLSQMHDVAALLRKDFRTAEIESKEPDLTSAFGYFGTHLLLLIPQDIFPKDYPQAVLPDKFELQLKTVFQHAWAEAEHDITYKSTSQWTDDQKRQIAFTAAQAWGADQIFDTLYRTTNQNEDTLQDET